MRYLFSQTIVLTKPLPLSFSPSSLALSGEMLLRHLGWTEAADVLVSGISKAIADKVMTYDLARLCDGATEVSCSAFAKAAVERM